MSANPRPKFWWVVASKPATGWHWRKFFEKPNRERQWREIEAPQSRTHIRNMRKGDVVVAYQAYERNVLALILLGSDGLFDDTRNEWDSFDLNPNPNGFVKLDTPVKLSELRNIPNAESDIDFLSYTRPQGTVFEITPRGRNGILKLIRAHNPKKRKRIAKLLDVSRKMRRARETSSASGPYIETGEKESLSTHRIGQGRIRQAALERYGNRCCLCRIDHPSLLVAGHIRGWARGKAARSNPKNVILMCALHDSLFGKGFMTLLPSRYTVEISRLLSQDARRQIESVTLKFRPPKGDPPGKQYLDWHRRFWNSSIHYATPT